MAWRRMMAWSVILVLVAGGCSKSETTGTTVGSSTTGPTTPTDAGGQQVIAPATPQPSTAWEQVLLEMADPLPVQVAIDAFSVAFRPIDGATPTDLEPGYTGSGTGPLRWILGHWEGLTLTQRAEVEAVLAAWEEGATSGAAGPGFVAAVSPFAAGRVGLGAGSPQAMVDDAVVSIEVLLGRSLSVPIIAKVAGSSAEVDNNFAVMLARNATGGFTGELASCTVLYNPKSMALSGAEAVALAAHEAFHCFEADLADSLDQAILRPRWIVEGMAEWVGETIAGGSSLSVGNWGTWLKYGEIGLFAREYSTIGFYSHIDDSGVELWERIDAAILASDVSSDAAYQVLIEGGDTDLVDSWAPGYFRDPARAPVWDQTGPGIPLDAPDIPAVALHDEQAYSLTAGPYAAFYAEVDVQSAAEVVTFESPGEGLAMFSDKTTHQLEDLHGAALCTSGACACPDGTPAAGTVFTPMPLGVIEIGATGHVFGSQVTVVGWSLERFCQQERCHVGTWTSGVWDVPRVIAGGQGAPLVITRDGEGWIDWSQASDLYGVVQGGTTAGTELLPLRLVLGGASHFLTEADGAGIRVTASAGSLGITPFIDLGDGWFETSGDSAYIGWGQIGGEATLACAGNTMYLNSAIQFWRVSTDAVIPGEAAELTPTTSGGGTPTTPGALPEVDPCTLLTVAEVQQLVPATTEPTGPDDLPTAFFSQCVFSPAVALQVYAPGSPDFFTGAADILDLTILDLPGIGDWALAQINEPDPTFGIEETVVLVAAGNSKGMVALVPYIEVFEGTPQFAALLELLELALSRL